MVKQAVILCGGQGERLRPLTYDIPKPMVDVNGHPFVYYLIKMLQGCGVEDVVLSIGYKKEYFIQHTSDLPAVRFVDSKDTSTLSVKVVPNLQDVFVVANGDVFPLLKWRLFLAYEIPTIAYKCSPKVHDAGIAITTKSMLMSGQFDCGNLCEMLLNKDVNGFVCTGDLHINDFKGLERARNYMKVWWKPQLSPA